MNKRGMLVLLFAFMITLSFSGFVSAQGIGGNIGFYVQDGINKAIEIARPIFGIFVGQYTTEDFFLTKVLIFILLFVIIKVSLRSVPQFKDIQGVINIVAFIVAILAIRYMKEDGIFAGILLPYSTLGIVLATAAPFIAFLYILHAGKANGAIRRLGWAIYFGVFITLFIVRYNEISKVGRIIYYVITGIILLCFVFDKGIHRYFQSHEMSVFYKQAKSKTVAGLQAEYMNILNLDTPEGDRRRKDIENHLKRLGADVP